MLLGAHVVSLVSTGTGETRNFALLVGSFIVKEQYQAVVPFVVLCLLGLMGLLSF